MVETVNYMGLLGLYKRLGMSQPSHVQDEIKRSRAQGRVSSGGLSHVLQEERPTS
jgi:hypothetical protein